jgi:hypothetical protein
MFSGGMTMAIQRVYVDSFEDETEETRVVSSAKSYWYFAFGSNMDAGRMRNRSMRWKKRVGATLYDWELVFNKCSTKTGGVMIGWANIQRAEGEAVEGVAYRLTTPLLYLDRYEPGYQRTWVSLETPDGRFPAVTYVASGGWTQSGLYPPDWYMDHLLKGKRFLTPAYYQRLLTHPVLTYTVTRRKY